MLDRCCLGIDAIDVISQNWRRDEKKDFLLIIYTSAEFITMLCARLGLK
jgi:hypothetical protein